MNAQHLNIIGDKFRLKMDAAQQIPSGPGGGHICWKIKSGKQTFFIKQLDPSLDVHDQKIIDRYELCEAVAFRFSQQGINAVCAIRCDSKSVNVLENSAYLVYPYIEGHTVNEISNDHALKISEVMANIHNINLDVPELEPKWDIHTNEEILSSIDNIASHDKSVSELLRNHQSLIIAMNERYLSVVPILKENTVVTHGDIFPHNVIWQTPTQPFLIDWEAVKKWNPTREVVRTCAAWSGIGDKPHSTILFENMLKTYINHGGRLDRHHIEAATNGVFGSIINWLIYSIDIVCSMDIARKNSALNEIHKCLISSEKLIELYPLILSSIKKISA